MRKIFFSLIMIFATLSINGCGSYAMSPNEFRQSIENSSMGAKDTVIINRPINRVIASIQAKESCFDREVVSSEMIDNATLVYGYRYNVRLSKSSGEMEWTMQKEHTKGVMDVVKPPEGGMYMVVVNAAPVDRTKTKMDLYYGKEMYGMDLGVRVAAAVKAWGEGKPAQCPDITKE